MFARRYIFFGGPLDMKSEITDGSPQFYIHTMKPLSFNPTKVEDTQYLPSTYDAQTYNMRHLSVLNSDVNVYVHESLTEHQVASKLSQLITLLINLYVEV